MRIICGPFPLSLPDTLTDPADILTSRATEIRSY